MIQLKSFPIEQTEEANKFMELHAPRSTEKQSGIVFHNGQIVIIHDDGIKNPEDEKGKIRGELEGDRSKLMLVNHSMEMAKTGLDSELKSLYEVAPQEYKIGMPDHEIGKLLNAIGDSAITPKNHIAKFKESVAPFEMRIQNLDNEILMDTHEVKRLEHSIAAWEAMLK